MSANELLKGYTPSQPIDIKTRNPLYNPEIPDMKDPERTIKSLRELKFKDMYSTQMRMDNQLRNTNGDGFSLDPNTKYMKRRDYDRIIDPNYLRVMNPRNKKHTESDDYFTGQAVLGYFDIPREIPKPTPPTLPAGVITPINAYQYTSRFMQDSNITTAKPAPKVAPPVPNLEKVTMPTKPEKIKPLSNMTGAGTDPTDDPAYINNQYEYNKAPQGYAAKLDEIERQRQESILKSNTSEKTSYDKEPTDKYGKAKIITPSKISIKPRTNYNKPI